LAVGWVARPLPRPRPRGAPPRWGGRPSLLTAPIKSCSKDVISVLPSAGRRLAPRPRLAISKCCSSSLQ